MTQGPSREQWEQRKDVITGLYRKMPLDQVQHNMETRYGFVANKRMYDRKFKAWNVTKYIKKEKKQELIDRVSEAVQNPEQLSHQNISIEEFSQTLRYLKKMRRESIDQTKASRGRKPRRPSEKHTPNAIVESPLSPDYAYIDLNYRQKDSLSRTGSDLSVLSFDGEPTPQASPTSSSGSPELQKTPSSTSNDFIHVFTDDLTIEDVSLLETQRQPFSLSRPPLTDQETLNMGAMLGHLRSYCGFLTENFSPGRLNSPDITGITGQAWRGIKYGIYLIKVGSPMRAKSALEKGLELMNSSITYESFEFVEQLFSTLSPANTKKCPEIRTRVLQLLSFKTRNILGPTHPLANLCNELQCDEQHREVSEKGLMCLFETTKSLLGSLGQVVFKIQCSVVALMRRERACDVAERIARDLVKTSNAAFGPGAWRSRVAASELAHVLMDTGDYDEALDLCRSIVERPNNTPSGQERLLHSDDRAVYAMEDIAEIHKRKGEPSERIIWLGQALDAASTLWGGSEATLHIVDDLVALLEKEGRTEEARLYKSRYVFDAQA